MISFKTAYYYILAVKINSIKFFKRIYFTTGLYKKSLISKVPNQFFFFPNPFLMSFFSNYRKFAFQINDLDPNSFCRQSYSKKVVAINDVEINNHQKFLKNELRKNYY